MGDTVSGFLPGERLLWTGRPVRGRVMAGHLGYPALLMASLRVWLTVYGRGGYVKVTGGVAAMELPMAAVVLATAVGALVWALQVKPAELRRTVYHVTDRRVLITTGPGHTWGAYLDQLAEPVLVPWRHGTADLWLRKRGKVPVRTPFIPGARQPFPVLRGLPDAELARQVISAGRARMLRGMLDVPPVPAPPGSAVPVGFVPAPGERIVWTGRPQTAPWWFGTADMVYSAFVAAFAAAFGFWVKWAVSAGAPLPVIAAIIAFILAVFGYPAVGRVLRRHARIKRSVYILTSWRLITTWGTDSRPAGTQCPLAQVLPPQVKNGTVLMDLAWPPPAPRRKPWARLTWPAASNDPPQLIGLPDPQAVADLICAAQLAERARTWQLTTPHIPGNEWPVR